MSNECENLIEVIGKKEVISKMFELVKSDDKDWGWDRRGLAFDFSRVIPYPEEFAKMDARKENSGYQAGGGDWCIQNWGTKWKGTFASAYFVESNKVTEVEGFKLLDYDNPVCGRIDYVTAWSPTFPVTKVLSEQFPELGFKHSYTEEGMLGSGYQIWKAGILIKNYKDESSAEVVIDNPVLLEILLKYKAMGMFDPDSDDFSIGNYEGFEIDSLTSHKQQTKAPALTVGLLKDADNWAFVPPNLNYVVSYLLDGIDISLYESDQNLVQQFRTELVEKNDEIMAGFRRVVWKYADGKVAQVFKFENGEESFSGHEGDEEEDEDFEEEDYDDEENEDHDDESDEDEDYEEELIESVSDENEEVEEDTTWSVQEVYAEPEFDKLIWEVEEKNIGEYEIKKYLGNETSPVFPGGVTSIGWGAFEECESIVSLRIPRQVDTIDFFAFKGCTNLVSVVLPKNNLLFIESNAFADCSSLSSIEFPKSIMSISNSAFKGCKNLTSIKIPEIRFYFGEGAFKDCSNLRSAILLGCNKIPENCFSGCEGLIALDIPKGVVSIDSEAFSGCASLTTVRIPRSVDYISSHAFNGCPNLVIHTPKGSYASDYAKQYGIPLIEE